MQKESSFEHVPNVISGLAGAKQRVLSKAATIHNSQLFKPLFHQCTMWLLLFVRVPVSKQAMKSSKGAISSGSSE
jgi:hypothetical protein